MLNMLNQYYNFLVLKMFEWLEKTNLHKGDRFYLLLNNQEDVHHFMEAIHNVKEYPVSLFDLSSDNLQYEPISARINGIRVVFAHTSRNITPDFLVTLRNRVGSQNGIWDNTAIIFISNEALDSIMGGASSLMRKDGPFHLETLKENLHKEIANSQLTYPEKQVIYQAIEERLPEEVTLTLDDFASIYYVIDKSELQKEDFNTLGFFYDRQLATFSDKKVIDERLKNNNDLFKKVSDAHNHEDTRNRLEEFLEGTPLIRKLVNEDKWEEVEFEEVKRAMDLHSDNKKIQFEFLEENITSLNKQAEIWVRKKSEFASNTANNRRTIHMMIFPNLDNPDLEISLPFDGPVSKGDVKATTFKWYQNGRRISDTVEYDVRGKKLLVKLTDFSAEDVFFGAMTYEHKNKLTFRFHFVIPGVRPAALKDIQSIFSVDSTKRRIELTESVNSLTLGNGTQIKNALITGREHGKLMLTADTQLHIDLSSYEYESEEEYQKEIEVQFHEYPLNIVVTDEKKTMVPKSALSIDKARRELDGDINYYGNKLIQGSKTYYPFKEHQKFLNWENALIYKGYKALIVEGGEVLAKELTLPKQLEDHYFELLSEIKGRNSLMSLIKTDHTLQGLLSAMLENIQETMAQLEENKPLPPNVRNIFYLGTVYDQDEDILYLSPLNPLLLAYQTMYQGELEEEVIPESVLGKLSAAELMPFINIKGKLYKSYFNKDNYRWLQYNLVSDEESKLSTFTRSIVATKLIDFHSHFKYLFMADHHTGMNIQLLNVVDEGEFVIGITQFLLAQIKNANSLARIIPVNVYVNGKNDRNHSLFKKLFELESVEEFELLVGESLKKYATLNHSVEDIMQAIKNSLNVYYSSPLQRHYHISFYQFSESSKQSVTKVDQLEKNHALNGVLSGNKFTKMDGYYVNGFGTAGKPLNRFLRFASSWNSLAAAARNNGFDNYVTGQTIVNNIHGLKHYFSDADFSDLFATSSWVCFINPNVDLRYFSEKENGLYIIHYSDQNNTQTYESITLTGEIGQYESVLNEKLSEYTSKANSEQIENILRSFNLLNGEWLLRVIGGKNNHSNVVREKMSIISSYKNLLALLDAPNFYWVPVSLEEILRVSRMLGLDSASDIFSAKELHYSGSTSDDLLFIGLEIVDEDDVNLHFVPIEVKIGQNQSGVIQKAIEQVSQTSAIFYTELTEDRDEKSFKKKFYRNFFVQIYLSNLQKMIDNHLWDEKDYQTVEQYTHLLLEDQFDISNKLESSIGKGLVVSFKMGSAYRKKRYLENEKVTLLELNERDAYEDVKKSIPEIHEEYLTDGRGFKLTSFIGRESGLDEDFVAVSHQSIEEQTWEVAEEHNRNYHYDPLKDMARKQNNGDDNESNTTRREAISTFTDADDTDDIDINQDVIIENAPEEWPTASSSDSRPLEDVRVLLGKVEGTNRNLYWEYGNKKLANRHMLITGKSGQGKTYFMQCLLFELAKQNISSVIIDYTNGFTANQLEDEFKGRLGEQIVHHIVYSDKLPINPFVRFDVDLGIGQLMPQDSQDMVDRVVSVLDFVFDLGVQQQYALKEVVKEVYEEYGDFITFTKIKEKLLEDGTNKNTALLGRIDPLLSRDPFSYEELNFNWNDIFNNKGEIHIFQLAGLQPQLQKILTEFLLWDMYNYSTVHGNKNKPLPILLDEAQNLNHKENSPTTKIMKEGRKFGWSAWFATQSLGSIKSAGGELGGLYNAAEQVHFLPTEDQTRVIGKTLSSGLNQSDYTEVLSSLQKGEAMVSGDVVNEYKKFAKVTEKIQITSLEER